MSLVPIGASVKDGYDAGHGFPFTAKGIEDRYPGIFFSQFTGAELVAVATHHDCWSRLCDPW